MASSTTTSTSGSSTSGSSSSFNGSSRSSNIPSDREEYEQRQAEKERKAERDGYRKFAHLFPERVPARVDEIIQAAQVLSILETRNTDLKEKIQIYQAEAATAKDQTKALIALQFTIEKLKEDAARPRSEPLSRQIIKLAPDALQVAALFGMIFYQSLKLSGAVVLAGVALGAAGHLSNMVVKSVEKGTTAANLGIKIIACLGLGAAILKGGHSVVTEGPQTVTAGIHKIRARIFPQAKRQENPHMQSMHPHSQRHPTSRFQEAESFPG